MKPLTPFAPQSAAPAPVASIEETWCVLETRKDGTTCAALVGATFPRSFAEPTALNCAQVWPESTFTAMSLADFQLAVAAPVAVAA